MIECSASMSALALVFMALIPALSKRYAAKWIYYARLVIVVGFIIPFRFHFRTVSIRADAVPSPLRQALPVNAGNFTAVATQVNAVQAGSTAIPRVQIIFAVWLAGAVVFLIYHGLRHARFIRMVKRWGGRPCSPRIPAALENIKNDMGIAGRISVRICPFVSSPMMIGFRNPVILLPRPDFSADELACVLRHELVHYKRKDLWFKGLVILAAAIHWFNSVVYLTAKAIALQCEISCDAEVVRGIGLALYLRIIASRFPKMGAGRI